MNNLLALFLCLCCVCDGRRFFGVGTGESAPTIGNGIAVVELITWHVGLYKKSKNYFRHICGGTIIAKQAVITAAHCFTPDRYITPASDYAVGAGKLYRLWNHPTDKIAQKFDVVQIYIPSRYQGSLANYQDDLAIAVLDRELIYNEGVRPACLNFDPVFDENELAVGRFGKVVGWGLTGANEQPSSSLQAATLPIVDIIQCIEQSPIGFRSSITSDKICAGYNNGTAVCRGDSGGGLIFTTYTNGYREHYLRGVISTSPTSEDACNLYTWATFTHILKHERFIKSVVPDVEQACSPQIENRYTDRLFKGTNTCVCK